VKWGVLGARSNGGRDVMTVTGEEELLDHLLEESVGITLFLLSGV
jgi:hypothetical protein